MIKWCKSAVHFLVIFCSFAVWAAEFPPSPNPFRYVNDYTQTLSAQDKAILESKLQQYGQQTSSQIAVVLVPTVGEYAISDYAFALGDKWGIGRKHLKNGVLMLIAKEDRKIFIATGQGLEGVLPDAFLSQLIRQQITPYFKQNLYAQGIDNGLNYLIAASQGEFAALENEEEDFEKYIPFAMIVIFILFVLFGEISWRRTPYISPSSHQTLETLARQRRRGRVIGGFGGGFGGSGGGSSGGFGGGGFDGGGAGGSW